MGPFPHDAPAAQIDDANPMGTDGIEFIEYAHPDPEKLEQLFKIMGFAPVARHRTKAVTLWRQGDINFIVNAEPDSFARRFAQAHGPCACAMAFRVVDAKQAFERALALGAKPIENKVRPTELNIPAIEGIGGSLIYFVDRYGQKGSIYDVDFHWSDEPNPRPKGHGFTYLDHLTHNVQRGRMDWWSQWYGRLFNFRQIRFFDIEGKLTGLQSRAMTSPCGKIRIPINESIDDKSQIEEYLHDYRGEGIQHVALGSDDLYAATDALHTAGLEFMPPPPASYYANLDGRVPGHGEPIDKLKTHGILVDGEGVVDGGETKVLMQIFSNTVLGPIFFEFIQRKGDDGFGEGNFRALFESIEEDQIRRGVLTA
jgi:4-hydroxyphenylpyruvate dioxygenase